MNYSTFTSETKAAVQEAMNYRGEISHIHNAVDLATFYGQKLWQIRNMLEEVGSTPGTYSVPYPEGMTEQDFCNCTCEQGEEPREE